MREFGISRRVRRWGNAQLVAIGIFAILATLASVVVPSLLLGGASWARLPADLVASLSGPAFAAPPAAHSPHQDPVNGKPVLPTSAPSTATPIATPTATAAGATTTATTRNGCPITAPELTGEQHLLALLNAHRAAAGVPALALDNTLRTEAREHSCDMQQHHHLSHTGSGGSTPFQRIRAAGVTYRVAGENIGETTGYALTAGIDRDDRDMMAEPLTPGNHHANIVSPAYTRVGLGVIYLGGQLYFTEDFVG